MAIVLQANQQPCRTTTIIAKNVSENKGVGRDVLKDGRIL